LDLREQATGGRRKLSNKIHRDVWSPYISIETGKRYGQDMQHSWGEISLIRMLVGKQRSQCKWWEGVKVDHKEVSLLCTRKEMWVP
jgi:hypothetical protein